MTMDDARYVTYHPKTDTYTVHQGNWSAPLRRDQAFAEERRGTPLRTGDEPVVRDPESWQAVAREGRRHA